ncbi:MAG: efflux RND transporter periplasmic adaptor subunit [Planctomycetota bacterium]|jgi:RND family efflux transporter MFP subunit
MTTPKTPEKNTQTPSGGWLPKLLAGVFKLALAVLILGGAMALYKHQIDTSPRARRQRPPRQPKLVQVMPVKKDRCPTVVNAMGPVVPARQVTLQPQVAGQIVEISDALIPGGIVQAGDKLVAIDPRDYEVLLQQRQGDLARARRDLKVEQGNQAVARQEYELLGEVIADEDRELVLREPQLASAQAALESAEAALQKAQLDLTRCNISVPFNAIIQEKLVDLGTTVSLNTRLATLIATDEAWIELKVPTSELKWLTIPQNNGDAGSSVRIYNTLGWGPDQFRTGRVVRLYGELETGGKLAQLLVAVDDPFCLKPENQGKPKLLIGSFVSAEIEGRVLDAVFPIPWSHLRDNNSAVWIMNSAGQLEIRPVEIVFAAPESAFIGEGVTEGEQLVVTDIAAAVAGMPLRIAGRQGEGAQRGAQRRPDKGARP